MQGPASPGMAFFFFSERRSMATLAELQAELAKYEATRDKILGGQEYSVADRRLRRPDLATIERRISELRFAIARAQGQTTTYPLFGAR